MAIGAFRRAKQRRPTTKGWSYPIYLVAESGDAAQLPGWRNQLQAALDGFLDELARRPDVADAILVGSLTHRTELFIEHRPLSPANGPLRLGAERMVATSYEAMFRTLAQVIERDRSVLTKDRIRFYRPLIVIALDTPPAGSDAWQAAHRDLVVDPDLADFGEVVARAIVVPLCTRPEAEADCVSMAYPDGIARAYRVTEPAQLGIALRDLLTVAAARLQLIAEGGDMPLLPTGDDLPPGLAELVRFGALPAREPVAQVQLPPGAVQ